MKAGWVFRWEMVFGTVVVIDGCMQVVDGASPSIFLVNIYVSEAAADQRLSSPDLTDYWHPDAA